LWGCRKLSGICFSGIGYLRTLRQAESMRGGCSHGAVSPRGWHALGASTQRGGYNNAKQIRFRGFGGGGCPDRAASSSVVLFVRVSYAKLAGLKRSPPNFSCLVRAEPIQGEFYDFKPRIHTVAIAASLLLNILCRSCRNRNRGVRLLARHQSG
jgi:hypothetical protein